MKNFFKLKLLLIICTSFLFCSGVNDSLSEDSILIQDMGIGWNLGNTFDTKHRDKTAWGNPLVSQELIDAIYNKGFKTIRIPITWQFNLGEAPDYIIDKQYLNDIEKLVAYALNKNMFVIINIHHDEDIIKPSYEHLEESLSIISSIWKQVAHHFKNYNNKLMFECLNEMRIIGSEKEWQGGTKEGRDCINKFHAEAVYIIRKTKAYNKTRKIIISPYAASPSQIALDELILPKDNNLLVAIHNYYPYDFALNRQGRSSWGDEQDKIDLDKELDRICNTLKPLGVPIIMGEWGNIDKNNTEDRIRHGSYFSNACRARNIVPIWWDNGILKHIPTNEAFGLINRYSCEWVHKGIVDAVVGPYKISN